MLDRSAILLPGHAWPSEWTADLRQMREDGLSYSQVAAALRQKYPHPFTRESVEGKCARLGIIPPCMWRIKWTDDLITDLKRMAERGYSASNIAGILTRDLGRPVTRSMVLGKLFRLGSRTKYVRTPTVKAPPIARNVVEAKKTCKAPAGFKFVGPGQVVARKAARPVRAEPVEPPSAFRCTLVELQPTSCRWPIGEPGSPDFSFCGHPSADITDRRPYCPFHLGKAYAPRGQVPWGQRI